MNNHTPMDDEAPIEDPEEELRPDKSDYAHTGAKVVITTAVTAAGTLIGGPLGTVIAGFLSPAITEFYNHVVTAPLSRREAVWLTKVYDSLKMIEAQLKDFDPSKVFEDPATFTAFLHASHIARRTHQEEKLNVLRNAVLNVALATAPEDSLQMIFLDIIDVTTPEHWRILEFLLDSGSYAKKRGVADLSGARIGGAEKGLFERTFPELVGHDQLVIAIVQD